VLGSEDRHGSAQIGAASTGNEMLLASPGGLFAPPNATVVATLLVAALSVSSAIFLILEIYNPYSGLIQVSSAPLRAAVAQLGQ
jgi:hypothetical protein